MQRNLYELIDQMERTRLVRAPRALCRSRTHDERAMRSWTRVFQNLGNDKTIHVSRVTERQALKSYEAIGECEFTTATKINGYLFKIVKKLGKLYIVMSFDKKSNRKALAFEISTSEFQKEGLWSETGEREESNESCRSQYATFSVGPFRRLCTHGASKRAFTINIRFKYRAFLIVVHPNAHFDINAYANGHFRQSFSVYPSPTHSRARPPGLPLCGTVSFSDYSLVVGKRVGSSVVKKLDFVAAVCYTRRRRSKAGAAASGAAEGSRANGE
ncbi:hypothetical protein EVAR_394_1 [Eumeta japonica]|uniref:Uncharacterized protein n=1 Tax=Eumeta variegata TaxID=151549 RepID=A0A4C1SB19_EUMVA|nr:hypothetical protein EVAR_394_1 [Eumeta japonica]